MMTVAEFGAEVERMIARVRPELTLGLIELGETVKHIAKARIGEEHDDWPPLAESTLIDKARKGFPVPDPLLRTGEFRESIKFIVEPRALLLVVGTEDPRGEWFEMGTHKMPPRPFLAPAMIEMLSPASRADQLPTASKIFGKVGIAIVSGGKI